MTREEVIRGLECCSAYDYRCNDCPYQDDGGAEDDCYSDELYADALALLKAQEPRVMTLEESLEADFCWFETHGWKDGDYFELMLRSPILDDESGRTFIDKHDDLFGFKDSEYGVTCRCWTSRPDQATREATPWN